MKRRRVAVVGGGLAGVTAAWQLAQRARAEGDLDATVYEASARLGGTVETVYQDGFTIECGPDSWVTEKPWARELVRELGLHGKLIGSNDAERATHILIDGQLRQMPEGMRMMVPADLASLAGSSLFSDSARQAYASEIERAEELRRAAPENDESIAVFIERHFGREVLDRVAAPLLSGVFGGDVARLSVRAVMPAFVQMEREHGSLILALQTQALSKQAGLSASVPVFTSLTGGTGLLIDRMKSELPPAWLRLNTAVTSLSRDDAGWVVGSEGSGERFDAVLVAVPAHASRSLLGPLSPRMAQLLELEESSAVIAALAFTDTFALPRGFGFLVPPGELSSLLAVTFVDQKFAERVPEGGRVLRAFFGGSQYAQVAVMPDQDIAALAHRELQAILGPLPVPAFHVVRRWPRSLPQYAVGHGERMAELHALAASLPHLSLLGNAYRGVGLPDLIRDARAAVRGLLGPA